MIVNTSISTLRLLTECKEQTSLDFQALRVKNAESMDALYDDFVINDSNKVDLYAPIQEFGADMAHALRTLLKSYSAGRDIICVEVECANDTPGMQDICESLLRKYFKYSILSWWYTSREEALAAVNAQKAAQALDDIFRMCVPRSGTRTMIYF
jgi:hypothetical protein